jgi:4-amino-4-deoxy-L-arabinose transferase-like glycosyltransferase/tetratricopeptide (TPR) repeat protein
VKQIADKIARKTGKDMPGLSRIPLWILPLLVSLLFFSARGVRTSPDSAWYTALGLNLYHGLGYVNTDLSPATYRGPVFPGLIALFFWLFGVSLKSAMGVVRSFFVLNVILIYAMGTRLFNRATGLIAALLVLTSLTIHQDSSRLLLDTVMPFFVLLSHLLLFIAFEENGNKRFVYFGLAGFALGIAFLTKSVAGIFLPLPALLWAVVPAYRKGKSWRGLLLFYGVALVVLLSWFIYLSGVSDEPARQVKIGLYVVLDPLLSPGGGTVGSTPGQPAPLVALGQWLSQLWSWLIIYYQRDFARQFALAPIFILAWGYVIFRAIAKQSRPETLLAGGLLFFLPLIPIQVINDYGTRHNFYLYLLSYLALARLLWPIKSRLPYPRALGVMGTTVVIVIQVWVGEQGLIHLLKGAEPSGYVPKLGVYAPSFGREGWEERGTHGKSVEEAAGWLTDNSAPGEPILMDQQLGNVLYFYLNARQPIYHMPYFESRYTYSNSDQDIRTPILFLWSYQDQTDPNDRRAFLNAVSEPQLLARIHELNIKYVLVTSRYGFISLYFMAHPDFEEIKHFGEGQIKIFKVRDPVSLVASSPKNTFEMHIGKGTPAFLDRLRRQEPDRVTDLSGLMSWPSNDRETIEQAYLQDTLGLSPMEIERVQSGQYPIVESNKVYTIEDYAILTRSRGSQTLEDAIALQRQKAELSPDNPWPYATLGALYVAQGDIKKALAVYEQAVAISPDAGEFRLYSARAHIVGEMQEIIDEDTTGNAMEALLLRLDSSSIIEAEGGRIYIVAENGQKAAVEGTVRLADGPVEGSRALAVDETTRLTGPASGINLSQGSLSLWARLTDLEEEYSTLVRVNNNDDLWLYRYTYDQGEGGRVVVYYNGVCLGFSSFAISDDQWHNYTFTWQADEQKFYIDGLQALSAEVPASSADTREFAIGWLGDQDGMEWEGFLADLMTFNQPLSEAEVGALYLLGPYIRGAR